MGTRSQAFQEWLRHRDRQPEVTLFDRFFRPFRSLIGFPASRLENHQSERCAALLSGTERIEQGFGPGSIPCADEQPCEQSNTVRRHRQSASMLSPREPGLLQTCHARRGLYSATPKLRRNSHLVRGLVTVPQTLRPRGLPPLDKTLVRRGSAAERVLLECSAVLLDRFADRKRKNVR